MPQLPDQLALPSQYSDETLYLKRLKERLAAQGDEKGDKVSYTMKMSRARHAKLLKYCDVQGITATDLLTAYIDDVLPVLMKAVPVEVPGYKKDKRTKPDQSRRSGRGRATE